jgi:probable biosynthetic protein (TIGR04098 family)
MLSAAHIDTVIEPGQSPQHQLELGMLQLGANGLIESSLYGEAIDFRLRALAERTGVRSRDIRAPGGQRLYATVFYLEMRTPRALPLACWRENDRLRFVDHSKLAGRGLLDGYLLFDSPDLESGHLPDRATPADLDGGAFAWIRAAHRFTHDQRGPGDLELAMPENLPPERAGQWPAPCTAVSVHRRTTSLALAPPSTPFRPVSPTPHRATLPIAVERDLNGVGLLYFVRYSQMVDIAERQLLADGLWPPCEDFMIIGRTPIARTICFFGNAAWNDTLLAETRLWAADDRPDELRVATGAYAPLRFRTQSALFRQSDRRLIAVSESEKVVLVPRVSPGVSGAIDRLLNAAPR